MLPIFSWDWEGIEERERRWTEFKVGVKFFVRRILKNWWPIYDTFLYWLVVIRMIFREDLFKPIILFLVNIAEKEPFCDIFEILDEITYEVEMFVTEKIINTLLCITVYFYIITGVFRILIPVVDYCSFRYVKFKSKALRSYWFFKDIFIFLYRLNRPWGQANIVFRSFIRVFKLYIIIPLRRRGYLYNPKVHSVSYRAFFIDRFGFWFSIFVRLIVYICVFMVLCHLLVDLFYWVEPRYRKWEMDFYETPFGKFLFKKIIDRMARGAKKLSEI